MIDGWTRWPLTLLSLEFNVYVFLLMSWSLNWVLVVTHLESFKCFLTNSQTFKSYSFTIVALDLAGIDDKVKD